MCVGRAGDLVFTLVFAPVPGLVLGTLFVATALLLNYG